MTAKTRLGNEGYGVRRIVSFAGKTQTVTITAVMAVTENPDIVSFTAVFGPRWTAKAIQAEIWTPAIIQSEPWTPRS